MTAARALGLIAALAAFAGAHGAAHAAPPAFHAEPDVRVIDTAANGTGAGAIVLRNDGTSNVVATSIVAAPGCDAAAVHASSLSGFTLAPGATRTLAISCTAALPGLDRCTYQVRAAGNAVLLEVEAVCVYGAATTLTASVPDLDFGPVTVGTTASRTIALGNGGDLAIDRLAFEITDRDDDFAIAAPCNPDARACDARVAPVAGGASTDVVVTCAPHTPGPHAAELHVATSAGSRLAAPITLACTGLAATTPVIAVSPTAVNLGAVELIDATAGTTVHLANAGTGTLQLLDVQIVDPGTGAALDWSYAAHAPCTPAIPATCALEAGASADLDLAFDPSAIGVRDATLLVHYHDTADRSMSIPLHAVGRGATLELVGGTTTLDFGALPLDATGALELQLVNRGTRDLTDATAVIMPALPAFTVTPGPTFTVKPGAPTTITIRCTPATAGPFVGTLHLAAPDVETEPINIALRCTGDRDQALVATPPAILLGEVRVAAARVVDLAITSVGAPVALTGARLQTPDPRLTVVVAPAPTPTDATLSVLADLEGPLNNELTITPATGPALTVAITGTAVTANYTVPPPLSLGTFCVEQPTTPRTVALASTGTATLGVSAPVLERADSPFDLALVAPTTYPADLPPLARAVVTITPKRQTVAGTVMDNVVWTTDADAPTAKTPLTATFVDNGPAVAPNALAFPPTTIHLDNGMAQPVTLRNCSTSPLQLDAPQIPAPFTVDSPSFPNVLMPGETTTFSVGFHPTKTGPVTKELILTSPQLRDITFVVTLSGTGIAEGEGSGSETIDPAFDHTSFYACGSCSTDHASGALAVTLAALCVVLRRRRRG